MINLLSKLKLFVAHFARKLHFKEFLLDKTMHLHVVIDPHATGWTVIALFPPVGNADLTKQIVALAAFSGSIDNPVAN